MADTAHAAGVVGFFTKHEGTSPPAHIPQVVLSLDLYSSVVSRYLRGMAWAVGERLWPDGFSVLLDPRETSLKSEVNILILIGWGCFDALMI